MKKGIKKWKRCPRRRSLASLARDERIRNINFGISIIQKNAEDFAIIYKGKDQAGEGMMASNETYALGGGQRLAMYAESRIAEKDHGR